MAPVDPFASIQADIPRDRYGRPLVVPPGGGKPQPYTRCTTFVGVLEDTFNLSRWSQRMVALGLADRPDLLLGVAAHRDDKDKLNALCADAQEAAKAHAAATTGTALHALTEIVDRNLDLPILPEAAQADIAAYRATTAHLDMVEIERFGVVDDLKVGGTWDRLVHLDGRHYIADVKTGSVDWGIGKIAMQLAVYAHALPYDHATGQRQPRDVQVDQARGIVIHLPAGTGTCRLLWVDLAAGWEAVDLAAQVRAWRARKNLAQPLTDTPPLADLVATAASVDDLNGLYFAHADHWTDDLTALAAARKNLLTTGAVA